MSDQASNRHSLSSEKLAAVLESVLLQLENGLEVDIPALKREYPEIASQMDLCVGNLKFIEGANRLLKDSNEPTELNRPNEQLPFQEIGDFRLIRELGRGGMGVVYEAEQLSLKRRVALKVLPFATLIDDRALHRFQNEVATVATLEHPNIVDVYSVACDRGVHHYAMRLISGQTLAQLVQRMNALECSDCWLFGSTALSGSEEKNGKAKGNDDGSDSGGSGSKPSHYFAAVAQYGVATANALEYAHQHGIVHRDIKPSNLLVDLKGKAWVTDFGLAQVNAGTRVTMTGDLLGTLRYMSPEQATGECTLDQRTDIFSLGATLYEMLTFRPAFDAQDHKQLLAQVIECQPLALHKINPRIPRDLVSVVMKAMEREPSDRYQAARHFAEDLQRFADGLPTEARPLSPAKRVIKWSKRHPGVMTSVAAIMLVIGVAAVVSNILVRKEARRVDSQRLRAEAAEEAAEEQARLAKRAAANARGVNHFLTDYVFARAEPKALASESSGGGLLNALEDAAEFAEQRFPDAPQLRGELYATIASLYWKLGSLEESKQHYAMAIQELKKIEDELAQEARVGAEISLARIENNDGQTGRAKERLESILEEASQEFGEASPSTISARLALSQVLLSEGSLQAAETEARNGVKLRLDRLGPAHQDTALAQLDLVRILNARGSVDETTELLANATSVLKDTLGIESYDTQMAMQLHASLLQSEDDLAAAEEVWRQIVQVRNKVQGPQHPRTLEAFNELAAILEGGNQLMEAEKMLKDLLELQAANGGFNATQSTRQRLRRVLYKRGKLAEAYDITWNDGQRVASEEEPGTLKTALEYGDSLLDSGQYSEAETLFRETLDAATKHLGEGHPVSAEALAKMTLSLLLQRKVFEADQTRDAILRSGWRDMANGLAEVSGVMSLVAGDPDPATESVLRDTLAIKRGQLPDSHLAIARTQVILACHVMLDDRYEEARELLESALATRKNELASDNWLLAETRSLLGAALTHLGKLEDAKPLVTNSYLSIANSAELNPLQKQEFLQRIVDFHTTNGASTEAAQWTSLLAEQLEECLPSMQLSEPSGLKYATLLKFRLGACRASLGQVANTAEKYVQAIAAGDVYRWHRSPHNSLSPTSAIDQSFREAIVRIFDGQQEPELASLWREMIELDRPGPQHDDEQFIQKCLEVWQASQQQYKSDEVLVRLAKAYCDVAWQSEERGDFKRAIELNRQALHELERTIKADGNNPALFAALAATNCSLASALLANHQPREGINCLERADEIRESIADWLAKNRGNGTNELIFTAESSTAYLGEQLLCSSNVQLRDPERVMELVQGEHTTHWIERQFRALRGLALIRLGKSLDALALFDEPRPDKMDHFVLCLAHAATGNRDEAMYHFDLGSAYQMGRRVAMELQTGYLRPLWRDLLFLDQLSEEAIKELDLDTEGIEAIRSYWTGFAYFRRQDPRSVEHFRRAIELQPSHMDAHYKFAETVLLAERSDLLNEALQSLRVFVTHQDADEIPADTYKLIALVHARRGNEQLAIKAAERGASEGADVSVVFREIATAMEDKQDFKGTLFALNRAFELSPEDAAIQNQLAWFLATCTDDSMHDPVRGTELAKKAVEAGHLGPIALNTLGVCYFRGERYAEAIDAFQNAMQLNDGQASPDQAFFLAMAHEHLGKSATAQQWLQQGLDAMAQLREPSEFLLQIQKEATELATSQQCNH